MKDLVYHRSLLPAASRFAGKTAVVDGDYTATYSEHLDRVLRLADAMKRELGFTREDRFAVLALNSHHYLELYHAGFLAAGIINPLNLRLAPTELEFILRDSETRTVFVDAPFADVIGRVREAAGVERVVLIGAGEVAHDVAFEDLVAMGEPVVPDEPEETDPVILMYTGGTTGTPKGVVIDNRAAMFTMYKIAGRWPFTSEYVYLHQTPMFHAASFGGVLVIPAVGGLSTFVPIFDPSAVLDVIERRQVNTTVMVPAMVTMLLDHPEFRPERLASLTSLTYGASPMPTALLDRLLQLLPTVEVFQGYGMTESCGLLTSLGPEEHRRGGDLRNSVGRPLHGSVISIQDLDGTILGPGETGEVCAKAGNIMQEYWNRPDQTAAAFGGGWYHTGDAGYLDGQGYLYLVDRLNDMIVSGGENVYSAEVENALASHPAVGQVAVIGIPSERWGEAVHAIVVLRAGAAATEVELQEWTRARIAGYKVPKSIEFRSGPLPLSGAMKTLKRQLRAPYWEGVERPVG
jgi:acyl-CoA synthetase (AMP-forming)/AMP-acid ligase II